MNYIITDNNLHIEDSYQVGKRSMDVVLCHIKAIDNEKPSKVWNRSIFSLRMEWVCHNFLYSLGLWKERTKDVDLDYPCDKPEWVYKVLGCLVWVFVK